MKDKIPVLDDVVKDFGNHLAFRLPVSTEAMKAVRWSRGELKDIVKAMLQMERDRIADWVKNNRKTQYVGDFTEEVVIYEDLINAIYHGALD